MKRDLLKKLWYNGFISYYIMVILGLVKFKFIKEEENGTLYQRRVSAKNPFILLLGIINLILCLLIFILRIVSDKFTEWYYTNSYTNILLKKNKENESANTSRNTKKV